VKTRIRTQIAVVGHDVTAYTDNGLARNTQYSYRVPSPEPKIGIFAV
jgi:hypothetical protein